MRNVPMTLDARLARRAERLRQWRIDHGIPLPEDIKIVNWEPLERAILHIMDEPDTHRQGIWATSCGTQRCVAGWMMHYADRPLVTPETPAEPVEYVRVDDYADPIAIQDAALSLLVGLPVGDDMGSNLNTAHLNIPNFGHLSNELFGGGLRWSQIMLAVGHLADLMGHILPERISASVERYRDDVRSYGGDVAPHHPHMMHLYAETEEDSTDDHC
jgi:hypothetical protein